MASPSKSILILAGLTGALVVCLPRQQAAPSNSAPAPSAANPGAKRKVSCLGRLVPGEKVIQLAGPHSLQGPAIVKELLVRRGQYVTNGTVIARLQTFDTTSAQLRQAQAEVEVLVRVLDQVKAGEKTSTIAAQQATVLRWEAEAKNAETVFLRDKEIFLQKAISQNDLDRSQLAWDVARKNYDQARNHLEGLKEIRDVDVRVAEARLRAGVETANRIRAELEQTVVRAPLDGTILEIRTYPGERLDREPIVEMGDVRQMNIEAEVYVTDIGQVRVGAAARATGDGFTGELTGTVQEIGMQVDRSSVFNPDPASFSDKRVVRVRIKLDQGDKVRNLVNHQVYVTISP